MKIIILSREDEDGVVWIRLDKEYFPDDMRVIEAAFSDLD